MNVRVEDPSSDDPPRTHGGRRRKGLVTVAAALLGAIAAPAAFAYWTSSGTGAGAAGTGTLRAVTIDSVDFITPLFPNGPAADVTVHLTNPNDYAVTIDSVTAGPLTSDRSGCDGAATGVTLDLHALTGNLPPGPAVFTASASMDATSVSSCQGATFSTVLTVTVHR